MRAILLTITGAGLMLTAMLAVAVAMTPRECDELSQWVYFQAENRDAGAKLLEHKAAVAEVNAGLGVDMVAMLMRELEKVYADGKAPLVAAMDARFECYARRGEIGTGV